MIFVTLPNWAKAVFPWLPAAWMFTYLTWFLTSGGLGCTVPGAGALTLILAHRTGQSIYRIRIYHRVYLIGSRSPDLLPKLILALTPTAVLRANNT